MMYKCFSLNHAVILASICAAALAQVVSEQHVLTSNSKGTHGAVASESALCSQIGIGILAKGGSAADAMVSTTLCVGVISSYHSGIGGGGLMLIRDSNGSYETLDYREAAPAAGHEYMYRGNVEGAVYGGLAVGVPGDLKGLEYIHKTHGLLPWRDVVQPVVDVARYGFPVTEDFLTMCEVVLKRSDFLTSDPVWAQDFAPNGKLHKVGDTMTRKRLANTLELIAKHGVEYFYTGPLAQEMVELIQATNGTLTLDDFKSYKAIVRRPLSIDYRGIKLFASSSPSSGAVTLSTLKTMEQYPHNDTFNHPNLTTHRFIEALRYGYGSRLRLGDPDFLDDITSYEDTMLSPSTAALHHAQIRDNSTRPVEDYIPADTAISFLPPTHGTSHMVTTDSTGLTISSTSTINLLFGAQIMTPRSGIILNNEQDDFSIPGTNNSFGYPPTERNFVKAGKRPLSSITPVIAEFANGTVAFVTGAAGGSRIISATAQVVWRMLEFGVVGGEYDGGGVGGVGVDDDVDVDNNNNNNDNDNDHDRHLPRARTARASGHKRQYSMREAMSHPRLHDQLMPNVTTFETGYDEAIVESMRDKGHDIVHTAIGGSSVQGIRRLWDGRWEAVGEPRQKNSGGFSR